MKKEKNDEHKKIEELIGENRKLLEDNQKVLKKLQRYVIVGTWARVVWYAILIGLPFALYFYLLEPYFEAFGSSFETFKEGVNELPGIKSIDILINPEE